MIEITAPAAVITTTMLAMIPNDGRAAAVGESVGGMVSATTADSKVSNEMDVSFKQQASNVPLG